MTTGTEQRAAAPAAHSTLHPLEPLSGPEISAAVEILRASGRAGERTRFATVVLHEPPKEAVLAWSPGTACDREAFAVLLDNTDGTTWEAVVSLTRGEVMRWTHVARVQPCIMLDEFFECEAAVRADPRFQEALRRRGIDDFELVMVDPWSAGNYGEEVEGTRRLARTLCWMRNGSPGDNGYAHPVEGLIVLVDLNRMQVVSVEDHGVVPVPRAPGNYSTEFVKEFRTDLRPLEVIQPEGPSFTVDGHHVRWQKWSLRLGFTPREGLVLHQVGYEDGGRVRPILYRASLSEMVVPYGDPGVSHARRNAFDVGEYGIGMLANALKLGCDCLGAIHYFDAHVTDSRGNVVELPNAICMHEEDYGILWKHWDWRTDHTEVRRSRRLVVSSISTVGNYEYGFFWYFYQDGTIQYEIKLTGILSTGAIEPGEKRPYGMELAPGLYASNHQHFFNVRMDMMVDGPDNSVHEVHTEAVPMGPENPRGNAFMAKATPLRTELEAQQLCDPLTGRYWKVSNPSVKNHVGDPVAYKLIPGETILSFAHPDSSVAKRAAFMTRHLWVTRYHPRERHAAGDYPNQHAGGSGLPEWTAADRPIENTGVVLWYTIGHHHLPRLEDWPVMPVGYTGFSLKPHGFFDRNPALDVPPSAPRHSRDLARENGQGHGHGPENGKGGASCCGS